MAEYPAHLEHEHRLFDGRTVTIRPIRPQDDLLERDFIDSGLSGENRYLRFQKWVAAPSDQLIHFLTDVDYDRHMAFVCTVRHGESEEIVGEARYVTNPDGKSCEFGIMIADAWHKSGIAGLLMDDLIRVARAKGLESVEGIVLRNNATMLKFVRALGFEVHHVPEDPVNARVVKKL
ncbi:MAG: GNAT family N-acetyltransferase [Burkholderiales bacterium]